MRDGANMPAFVVLCGYYTISLTGLPPRHSAKANGVSATEGARRGLRQGLALRDRVFFHIGVSAEVTTRDADYVQA